MRRTLRLAAIASLTALVGTAACNDYLTGVEQLSYAFRVDSVTGPTAFSGAAPATVFVWGHVGTNDCHRFLGFDTARTSNEQVDAIAVGHYERRGSRDCASAIVDIKGQPFTIAPPITRPFLIVFHQPDGTTLTRTLQGE